MGVVERSVFVFPVPTGIFHSPQILLTLKKPRWRPVELSDIPRQPHGKIRHCEQCKRIEFQLRVESKLGLLWFCITTLCDWSLSSNQPIRCKTKTNYDLDTRIFPRLTPVTCFASKSDWFVVLFAGCNLIHYCDGFGFDLRRSRTLNNRSCIIIDWFRLSDF